MPLLLLLLLSAFTWAAAAPDFPSGLARQGLAPSQVITPDSPHFHEFTERYLRSNSPSYAAIVVANSEADVADAVRFAADHDVPFAAKATGHGPWRGLADMRDGLGIWLRNLSRVDIAPDGKHVVVGGGVLVAELVAKLWAAGKQTASGICQCVGVAGSGFGGGVGPFMGEYGLGLDQIVSARVVLASGEVVVTSEDERPDLLWALKGAGHNFGVVTEMTLRIYDRKEGEAWAAAFVIFTQEKLEDLIAELNRNLAGKPGHLSYDLLMVRDPTTDPDNAILLLRLFSNTFSISELETYIGPLRGLSPVFTQVFPTDYLGLIQELGYGLGSPTCTPGHYGGIFGIGVEHYVASDIREFYDLFNEATEAPELATSYVFIEAYGTSAMRSVPSQSTAYAHRHLNALLTVAVVYDAAAPDPELDRQVDQWGEKMRTALLKSQTRQESYVNYAGKQETLEAMYGHDCWRLEKLRRLKKEYDPKNRFGFYAPINTEQEEDRAVRYISSGNMELILGGGA